MKTSEAIEAYREKISAAMREDYRAVLEAKGRIEYKIYVWEDGELVEMCEPQGSNAWLQPRDHETRDLFEVVTVSYPFFDPWDCTSESIPDDEAEREKAEAEIIDWLCDEYVHEVETIIDEQIRSAKEEESIDW